MVSALQVIILAANSIVLIYYGGKWIKIRSLYNKTSSTKEIQINAESLKEAVGKYIFVSGTVKTLTEGLPSKYSDGVSAVIQNIQKV